VVSAADGGEGEAPAAARAGEARASRQQPVDRTGLPMQPTNDAVTPDGDGGIDRLRAHALGRGGSLAREHPQPGTPRRVL